MHLSADISMYPLQDGYKPKIKAFLNDINTRAEGVEIRTSNMSTRLFGDFDAVQNLLNSAMKVSMQKYGKIVFVVKFLQGDARDLKNYE